MSNSWIVILPPLIVLGLAAWTHNVIRSLVVGIAFAALIATDFSIMPSLLLIKNVILQVLSADNVYLFIFLILLGVLIEMMTHAGGIKASTKLLQKYIKNSRAAQTSSLILSNIFILDDYLNGLIVGAIIKPLTDAAQVPRAKLAFLINSISSPICLLIPATTWVAITLGYLQDAGLTDKMSDNAKIFADPLYTYLQLIPFIFYSIFIIFSAWFIVRKGISFGTMRHYEIIAQKSGNLYGGKEPAHQTALITHDHGSIFAFIIPLSTFFFTIIFCIFYTGNSTLLGGTNTLLDTLKSAAALWSLFVGSIIATIIATIYYLRERYLSPHKILENIHDGFQLTRNSIIILFFAYIFAKILTDHLNIGLYLAGTVATIMPLALLPVVTFWVGAMITASTGSSWSTIALMIPIMLNILTSWAHGALPLAIPQIPQFFATLGALLSGSVAGAHLSPITDSTIMSSTASGCYHLDHVKTQIAYSIPAFIGTSLAYLILGLLGNQTSLIGYIIAFIVGLTTTTGILLYKNQNKIVK